MTTELNKAITEAAEAGVTLLKKSQMALDFTQPHHKEYTRTNDRGTVSHVKAKGAQQLDVHLPKQTAKEIALDKRLKKHGIDTVAELRSKGVNIIKREVSGFNDSTITSRGVEKDNHQSTSIRDHIHETTESRQVYRHYGMQTGSGKELYGHHSLPYALKADDVERDKIVAERDKAQKIHSAPNNTDRSNTANSVDKWNRVLEQYDNPQRYGHKDEASVLKYHGVTFTSKKETDLGVTYFKGDKARYTGETDVVGGKMFYEIQMLEGHEKGKTKLVSKTPRRGDEIAGSKLQAAAPPAAKPTGDSVLQELIAKAPKNVDGVSIESRKDRSSEATDGQLIHELYLHSGSKEVCVGRYRNSMAAEKIATDLREHFKVVEPKKFEVDEGDED